VQSEVTQKRWLLSLVCLKKRDIYRRSGGRRCDDLTAYAEMLGRSYISSFYHILRCGTRIEAILEANFITRIGESVLHSVFIIFRDFIFIFGNWIMSFKERIGDSILKFYRLSF